MEGQPPPLARWSGFLLVARPLPTAGFVGAQAYDLPQGCLTGATAYCALSQLVGEPLPAHRSEQATQEVLGRGKRRL